jgi:(2R)-3-sulfolactate dehydrogenase (NADP+)
MPTFDPAALQSLTEAALTGSGASPKAALSTARALVAADLQGMASHGVARAPFYCAHIKNGRVVGHAEPAIRHGRGGAFLVDAGNGLAFPACDLAVSEAVKRANEFGISYAAITNSNHFGMAAHHLLPIAAEGLVALAFSNAPPAMPMAGGKRAVFGTNPIAAVFPRKDAPALSIDLSLSEVAKGKLMVAAREGKSIPLGWALDEHGNPTTDPKAGLKGLMVPMGGTKGAMLALTVELLCAALSGSALSIEADQFYADKGNQARLGQGFLVIDPGALAGRDVFLARVETLVDHLLEEEGVRLPGARRAALQEKLGNEGVTIPDELLAQLKGLAKPA